MNPKISIIIPVYNVEQYLPKCLDSCLGQDIPHDEYEIIVVIDGSPDHSIDIARQYQQQYNNIKIIEQPNGGLSTARNTGLRNAKGEYVWFIDSDDYISANCLKRIYAVLSDNNLECLWIQWIPVNEEGKNLPVRDAHYKCKDYFVYEGKDFMAKLLTSYLFAWSFIYSREYLLSKGLNFTPGMLYEDADFAFRSLPLLNRIRLYDAVVYYYRQRLNSIMHTVSSSKFPSTCANALNAYKNYQTECGKELKDFYFRCYTIFLLGTLKDVSRIKDYKCYLDRLSLFVKKYQMVKVMLYGSPYSKIAGKIYNICGVSGTFLFYRVLFKIQALLRSLNIIIR